MSAVLSDGPAVECGSPFSGVLVDLRFLVSDLLVRPGASRRERATATLTVQLEQASVDGDVSVDVEFRSLVDGVSVHGRAHAVARLTCVRCLVEWDHPVEASLEHVYRRDPDEDGWCLEDGGWLDLEPLVHDEVALALPLVPLCRLDCRGLCPTCGADLNRDPCAGHGDESSSPFAALKQLFDLAD